MENKVQIFSSEEFGQIRAVKLKGEDYFVGKDIAESLGYSRPTKAVSDHVDSDDIDEVPIQDSIGRMQRTPIINESGVYALIFGSKLPSAKKFKRWVTSEVLPTIRKTGGYVANDDIFISTYLPFADDTTKSLFKATLATVRNQNEIINRQQKEIEYKNEVLIGVTEDIDIYTKRNVLNKVVRYKGANFKERWIELYDRFREVYSIDLPARTKGYNIKQIKKKDHLSIIKYAEQFGHLDDLYKVAVKLYETDTKEILVSLQKVVS